MSIPYRDRITITVAEFCDATGLGRTKANELMAAGAVETKNVGRRKLILVRSVLKLLEGSDEPDGDRRAA